MSADRQRRIDELQTTVDRLVSDIDKTQRELDEKRLTLELLQAQINHLGGTHAIVTGQVFIGQAVGKVKP